MTINSVLTRDNRVIPFDRDVLFNHVQYFSNDISNIESNSINSRPVEDSIKFMRKLNIDVELIVDKTTNELFDGIDTSKIDEICANICASYIIRHPDYNILAGRLIVYELHKTHDINYKFCNVMADIPNINKTLTIDNPSIDEVIDYSRDYYFDYCALKALQRTYLLTGELPQHMLMRVSLCIHGCGFDAIETYDLLSRHYFTHASPTIFNAGTTKQQLASCFLLDVDDSIASLADSWKHCGFISKFGGGIGLNISKLRATNSRINGTGGISSGIVSWCKIYNEIARGVNQSGKRNGSIAVYISPWHADINVLLDLRKNSGSEELRARDLFYALWVPDLFMERIRDDGEWCLMCPNESPGLNDVYGKEFNELYTKYEKEGRYRTKINAKDLWVKILHTQMETGMPYITYKDRINERNNLSNVGIVRNSNLCSEITIPSTTDEHAVCIVEGTPVLTPDGYKPIEDVTHVLAPYVNDERLELNPRSIYAMPVNKGLQYTMIIETDDGNTIESTEDHYFITKDLIWTKAKDLTLNDALVTPRVSNGVCKRVCNNDYIMLGKSLDNNSRCIEYCKNKFTNSLITPDLINGLMYKEHINSLSDFLNGVLSSSCVSLVDSSRKLIISSVVSLSLIKAFAIVGVHSSRYDDTSIVIKSTSFKSIIDNVGISANERLYKSMLDSVQSSTCITQESLGRGHKRSRTNSDLGCYKVSTDAIVSTPNASRDDNIYSNIKSITYTHTKKRVYDLLMTSSHVYIAKGYATHNCNLASICLPRYVDLETKTFDFDKLQNTVRVITTNLNNVIDNTYYPTDGGHVHNTKTRPIGIGVQGLADTFCILSLSFEDNEAKELNRKIFETIYYGALKQSCELSKVKGPYDAYKGSPLSHGKFQFDLVKDFDNSTLTYDWDKLRDDIIKHGVRNSLTTAVMPTASTSLIMGNTESIEPVSLLVKRGTLSGEHVIINKYLVNELSKLNLWNDMVRTTIKLTGSIQSIKEIPDNLKRIYKIGFEMSMKTYIEHSIIRSPFVDQSQSLNLWLGTSSIQRLHSMLFYGWNGGLKTGSYYLRTKPAVEAINYTTSVEDEKNVMSSLQPCENCSA